MKATWEEFEFWPIFSKIQILNTKLWLILHIWIFLRLFYFNKQCIHIKINKYINKGFVFIFSWENKHKQTHFPHPPSNKQRKNLSQYKKNTSDRKTIWKCKHSLMGSLNVCVYYFSTQSTFLTKYKSYRQVAAQWDIDAFMSQQILRSYVGGEESLHLHRMGILVRIWGDIKNTIWAEAWSESFLNLANLFLQSGFTKVKSYRAADFEWPVGFAYQLSSVLHWV